MIAKMDIVPGACLTAVIAALSVAPTLACAQAPADRDAAIATRVRAALDADPYYYAAHTEVTVEHGDVVLTGIVWDNRAMFEAVDDAKKAAPGRKIINHLSITQISHR